MCECDMLLFCSATSIRIFFFYINCLGNKSKLKSNKSERKDFLIFTQMYNTHTHICIYIHIEMKIKATRYGFLYI